ncbi:hypothetical protein C086_00973 [Brucella abortus F6/05-3]|uniref:hypothetical protein n=1 Tax=Brucella abortus TaxID=235 RepID=UPI0002CFEE3E|nr:hypothetical protein [Brucella abortus]AIJ54056.1 hypothetical protein DK51_438 [Brucella abortus]AIJ76739.1 hypothetical protein DO75_995 [Brucella abortus]ENP35653.1 hypothetical protein C088_00938 [Brucella abortus 65/110]ENP40982.1 hypothetical protein C055_00874 [Brucella abortus 78/36]ENQ04580.1 hypothetical protein C031_00931 [Brucella abortus F6/05-2]
MKNCIAACLTLLPVSLSVSAVMAADKDKQFFQTIEGQWSGPGEIVAGKYKGTKFVCNLAGTTPDDTVGMTLDGTCRVGVFSQPMKATVARVGDGYAGKFNDGANGKGLDVTSGSVNGNKVVFGLNRKQLNGAMLARVSDPNTMNVTVSVRVEKELVPVIGMSLKRVDTIAVGSIAKN